MDNLSYCPASPTKEHLFVDRHPHDVPPCTYCGRTTRQISAKIALESALKYQQLRLKSGSKTVNKKVPRQQPKPGKPEKIEPGAVPIHLINKES